jgi:phenylalanine-4-hydroxylase
MVKRMASTELLTEIPIYLKPFIAHQDPSLYTPMDHASWRYILKLSREFFAQHAHQKYLDGLLETGISTERIPLIEEMDACLRRFRWRAVPVVGFIPPAAFMEFLSLGVLPIACDMRTIEHLAYTPAPDIVHEAAGHAPIVSDPEYADYLRSYGEISRKAIFSVQDMDVYQAIRLLSDTKENPSSTPSQIEAAQKQLDDSLAAVTYDSEATLLSRMGWWTFEYGLVGSLKEPKIYGAGLLSSLGESYHCLSSEVKKVPFSVDCIEMTYDITRPQPQLFVAPDFQTLKRGLQELANQMAFRRGGVEGLEKALKSKTVTTTALDTGIQVSGVLVDFMKNEKGRPYFIKFQGPSQISYQDAELQNQGATYHREGFSSPIEKVSEAQLNAGGFEPGKKGQLIFQSGITLEGKLVHSLKKNRNLVLLSFEECTVKKGNTVLFQPEWGTFDMVCGDSVTSVFGGAADRKRYLEDTGGFQQEPAKPKTNLTKNNQELNSLYAKVREFREQATQVGSLPENRLSELDTIHRQLESHFSQDWLLRYELLELCKQFDLQPSWERPCRKRLDQITREASPDISETIQRGLKLL